MESNTKAYFDLAIKIENNEISASGTTFLKLLNAIDKSNSIKEASKQIDTDYQNAVSIINDAENMFSKRIVINDNCEFSKTISLTEFGKDLTFKFSEFEKEFQKYAKEKLPEYLEDFKA